MTKGSEHQRSRGQSLRTSILSLGMGVGVQGVASLITVPLLFRHLGDARFGIWALVTSVFVLLAPLDLGLGNTLVQRVTAARATDADAAAEQAIRNVVGASLVLGVFVAALAAATTSFVDWTALLNTGGAVQQGELNRTVLVIGGSFAVGLLGSVAERLQVALQLAHRNGATAVVSSMLTVAAVIVLTNADAGLPWIVAASTATLPLTRLCSLVLLAARQERWLVVALTRPSTAHVRGLVGTSALYASLQLAATVTYNSDQVVIARILGSEKVTAYAIPAKLFGLLVAGVGIVCTPLWPALAEARHRSDWAWFRRTVARVWIGLLGLSGAFGLTLAVAGPTVLARWIGSDYKPDRSMLFAFAAWGVIYASASLVAVVMQSLGSLRSLLVVGVSTALLSLVFSIALVRSSGPAGAVWGTCLAYGVVLAVTGPIVWRQIRVLIGDGIGEDSLRAPVPSIGGGGAQ
jgi:O-antigen/teichoic acid export membrane protein